MRVTIIKADNAVYVGGVAMLGIDCSALPVNFHALQWYGTWGDLETNVNGQHANERITDFAPYQQYVDAWNAKKAAPDAAAASSVKAKTGGVSVIS
jgi:hypothetical protein